MKKYYKYELNMLLMNILAIVIFVVPIIILEICGFHTIVNIQPSIFIIGMVFYLILHELFHGLGYSLFAKDKKNIKFGIVLEKGVLYAACQEKINKNAILISLLLPTIFLSIITFPIGMILNLNYLVIYSIINFAGAIGDILMTVLIVRGPKDLEYLDYNNDIGAYLISKSDLSEFKSLGFHLTEQGIASEKKVDKSIKRFYVSKTSGLILMLLIFIYIINIILKFI